MSEAVKKRSKFSGSSGRESKRGDTIGNEVSWEGEGRKNKKFPKHQEVREQDNNQLSWASGFNTIVGLALMVAVSFINSKYMYQIHENNLWFTNIKEVEREISFRTESGLYYSYFKQLMHAPSLMQGVKQLTDDHLTEHPDKINILQRMNVYQEIILAFIYKALGLKMQPIFFYIYSVFCLHALLVAALYLMAWFLTNTWVAGLLTAAFYIFNRNDTTRVSFTIPLRESFSLPFLWMQLAALTVYFKPKVTGYIQSTSLVAVVVTTFFTCLFWQFNQFIIMFQAFSLFGVWILGFMPVYKVRNVLLCLLACLMAVCLLQFGNKMILGSMAVSFIIVSLALISYMGDQSKAGTVISHVVRVTGVSLLSLVLMIILSMIIKIALSIDSDEHIFKYLLRKLGVDDSRDFDSSLYLCLGIFGFITWDVFERLNQNFVLPFYVLTHVVLLMCLAYTVLQAWRRPKITKEELKVNGSKTEGEEKNSGTKTIGCLSHRPELVFHTVQATFFGALAITAMRMKFFWTPYVCVLAAVGIADESMWTTVLHRIRVRQEYVVTVVRSSVTVLVLGIMTAKLLPGVLKELEEETEFWDPDTVQLMEWIVKSTKMTASFTGSMQLLAGVKLCTGRPITNHPHYEDKHLRHKTKELYQIYARRVPEEVHAILKNYKSDYIILEDSICRAASRGGCRLPDLLDIDNGMMPDEPVNITGLIRSSVPRFCELVRHKKPNYTKYFKSVFVNKTFRMYQVL